MNSYRVAVVGLGKIGLPLAAHLAGRGHSVVGSDIRQDVVDSVNAGSSHVMDEAGLADAVAAAVANGHLTATTEARTSSRTTARSTSRCGRSGRACRRTPR